VKIRARLFSLVRISIFASLLFSSSALAVRAQLNFSTVEQIKTEFETVPCNNKDRLSATRALFEKMGATEADFSSDKHKSVENLIVRKPGSADGIIIVGAHYDKVEDGCGAVDNWTGIVTLAHLYRTLKNVTPKKTILFIAFGKEEDGLIGSHAFARAIKKEETSQYCEMVNIDSFGMAAPQVLDNVSNQKLAALAADCAKEMKVGFNHARVEDADADSSSFNERKIPAVTLHGLNNDWPLILHSIEDQPKKVNATSVYLGYRLILLMLARLDSAPCEAYR